jgi:L-methionine (R)-S-oxide reductase
VIELNEEIEKKAFFAKAHAKAQEALKDHLDQKDLLLLVCQALYDAVPYYDWVGFYLIGPDQSDLLHLGPYVGKPTEHVKIPFGQGVCGQVALSKETLVIDDVQKEDNYLSCSIEVCSEIVVPLVKEGIFLGELDIDSHKKNAFCKQDQQFLEKISLQLSKVLNQV